MSTNPQERRRNTVARVEAFFRENPHEELQLTEMQAKFGISYRAAQMAAVRLRDRGGYESVHVLRLQGGRAAAGSPAELQRRLDLLGEQLDWIRSAAGGLTGASGIEDTAAEAQAHVHRLREVLEGQPAAVPGQKGGDDAARG